MDRGGHGTWTLRIPECLVCLFWDNLRPCQDLIPLFGYLNRLLLDFWELNSLFPDFNSLQTMDPSVPEPIYRKWARQGGGVQGKGWG